MRALYTVAAIVISLPMMAHANSPNEIKVTDVAVSSQRSKLICAKARDSAAAEQSSAINAQLEKLNGRIISVSAPSASVDWANGGPVCVTVTFLKSTKEVEQ